GGFVQHLEMCELDELRKEVSASEIAAKRLEIAEAFYVLDECPEAELDRAAHTAVAMDKLVARHQLGSICYYYEGMPDNAYEDIISSVITGNSMLTSRNVPVAGEYEVKNIQAMKIMDLFGAGGSFTEFYGLDFNEE